MSCTNSPSWVRLRHSTIGTTSPYAEAAVHHPDLGAELGRLRAWGYLA